MRKKKVREGCSSRRRQSKVSLESSVQAHRPSGRDKDNQTRTGFEGYQLLALAVGMARLHRLKVRPRKEGHTSLTPHKHGCLSQLFELGSPTTKNKSKSECKRAGP